MRASRSSITSSPRTITQGRTAGCDESAVLGARARRPLADTLLAVKRAGVHRARRVHRQPGRRTAADDADRAFVPPARGAGPATPPAPGQGAPAGPPVHNGQAYWLKVVARDDGSFTVTNTRNGFTKTYARR